MFVKPLRFNMSDDNRDSLEKRIAEHIQRGAKQISEVVEIRKDGKKFVPTGYHKAPREFEENFGSVLYKVRMEIVRGEGERDRATDIV